MKNFGLLFLALAGFVSTINAQENWCGTDAQLQKSISENPTSLQAFIEHNMRISAGQMTFQDRSDPIIIPVVVHVLHDNGIGNISYEQIVSGINQLNEDYNKLNADTIDTRNTAEAPFIPIAANVGVQFALAKIDPNGNCTNGVERRNSPVATYNGGEHSKYYASGGLDAWPRQNYMNIWIVNSIESDGGAGVTLGYAQFPQFADDGYGLIIRHDSYGTVGTASGDRTLTHEIGHCLGLLHTFQGPFFGPGTGCHTADCGANGDFCCDTPPATAAHWNCPPTYNSCTSIPANDPYGFDAYDQWENFMSYAPCQNMLSEDQKNVILNNLSNISFLSSLVSLTNQTNTGVSSPAVLCQADFISNKTIICAGDSISFSDQSFFNVTGWNWTFPGGSPANSTDTNPIVTYDNSGNYTVTLEVTDGISTETISIPNYVLVLSDPGDNLPYKESFENLTGVPDNDRFMVENDNGGSTWALSTTVGYMGYKCAVLNNYGVTDNSEDALISGTIDLSGVNASDPMIFNFRYAYNRKSASDDEWLRFYVSKDCGKTWALRKNIHGSSLSSDITSGPYTPLSPDDWQLVNITNITSDYYVSSFRYKIVFENNSGNNIYVDYINMYPQSMTGIEENQNNNSISLYPNPTNENFTLTVNVDVASTYYITIFDALGNSVENIFSGDLSAGLSSFEYSAANLAAGIYVIRIEGDELVKTVKLIKQ